jgi:VanZ family protein
MRRITAYWMVLGWMAVIFIASTNLGSSGQTGRIIRPILQWFNPDVSEETVKAVQAVVRKSGHLTEYAILAILWWRARAVARGSERCDSREFWIVLACCAAYAASDELHQLFVSTRQASVIDVLIDSTGAAIGLGLIRLTMKRWNNFLFARPAIRS